MNVLSKTNIICTIITVLCCTFAMLSIVDISGTRSKVSKWRGPGNLRCIILSLNKRSDGTPLHSRLFFADSKDNAIAEQIRLESGSLLVLWSPQQIPKKAIAFAKGYCARNILAGQAEKEFISLMMDECPGVSCTNEACQLVHALFHEKEHGVLRELEE